MDSGMGKWEITIYMDSRMGKWERGRNSGHFRNTQKKGGNYRNVGNTEITKHGLQNGKVGKRKEQWSFS